MQLHAADMKNRNWMAPFQILSAQSGHGGIGLNGDLGYEDLHVTNSPDFRWTVSAHANSRVEVVVHEPVKIRGFLNGSASFFTGAEFKINGRSIGSVYQAHDITDSIELPPGKYVLEIESYGSICYGHTVWGMDKPFTTRSSPTHYVSIGAICKDENHHLVDWVRHHLSIGVSHIYLLDNESNIPLATTLAEAGLSDQVTVERFTSTAPLVQINSYLYLLRKYGPECRWMALIDIDEYIVVKISPSLPRFLLAYEDFGAVKVRWMMFGSNGHTDFQPDPMTAYTDCYENHHFKSIVQPRFVIALSTPHQVHTMEGKRIVGEHFGAEESTVHIQLNHYWTKSSSDWIAKMARGNLDNLNPRSQQNFHDHQNLCKYRDNAVKELQEQLHRKEPPSTNKRPLAGFIHVAAVNHWRAILRSQLRKIVSSGLLEVCDCIKIGIVGADEGILQELNFLPEKVSVMFCQPELRQFEFPTLAALQDHCRLHGGDVWYIHSKGSVNVSHQQEAWRSRMEATILVQHEVMREKLAAGYDAACGYGCADYRWPMPGNFWWARSEFLLTLPHMREDVDWSHRWNAEHWIGLTGTDRFYQHDFGNRVFETYRIISSAAFAGAVSTNGHHGWNTERVLVPKDWRYDQLISAHAPSTIELEVRRTITIYGFLSDTCDPNHGKWCAEFKVDGTSFDPRDGPSRRTREIALEPGIHHLEIVITQGEPWGAHTGWGIIENTLATCKS
ncbi:MAG: glycosyltransferase family 2 protein [Verrucomicrobiota bacterium]